MFSPKSPNKSLEDFVDKNELNAAHVKGKHNNAVRIVTKRPPADMAQLTSKYTNLWFLKTIKDAHGDTYKEKPEAYREVVAQEFFRLLFPHYPKTRLIDRHGTYYILSKGIPGFKEIETSSFNSKIHNGAMTGFGFALIASLVGDEIDMKYQNMGTDAQGRIVRFDGGWCFASLSDFKYNNYTITNDELSALPYLDKRFAYNWLEAIMYQSKKSHTSCIDIQMKQDGHRVREEINQATLFALMIPLEMIKTFVSQYVPSDESINDMLAKTLATRLTELKTSALQNKSFLKYLASNKASEDFTMQLGNLLSFKTTNKTRLVDKFSQLEEMAKNNFAELRHRVLPQSNPVASIVDSSGSSSSAPLVSISSSAAMLEATIAPTVTIATPVINIPVIAPVVANFAVASNVGPAASHHQKPPKAPPRPLTQLEEDDLLLELTGGMTPKDVLEIKTCVQDEIKRKVTKNRSQFTFRDKQLEDSRIRIWDEVVSNKTITPIIIKSVLVNAIRNNITTTQSRYSETHKGAIADTANLDMGKIYEKMAQKLVSIAPKAFKDIIIAVVKEENLQDASILLKNVKHNFTATEINLLNTSISENRQYRR